MANNFQHLHAGHRQRLKDKVRRSGVKVLSNHEILELLLTYTIPYRDTNELAHMLMTRYGSLAGVLTADFDDLRKVNGVGEETALFLTMMPDVLDVVKNDLIKVKAIKLDTVAKCVSYFRAAFQMKNKENLVIFCLNKLYHLVKTVTMDGSTDANISLDVKKICGEVNDPNIASVVLMHTHPHGTAMPSEADICATKNLVFMCYLMGIRVQDHIIFADDGHFSFSTNGLLDSMNKECDTTFSTRKVRAELMEKAASGYVYQDTKEEDIPYPELEKHKNE